jgi:hypothetical protein
MLTDQPGSWRPAFQIVGLVGIGWAVLWAVSVWNQDLSASTADDPAGAKDSAESQAGQPFREIVLSRKFLTLVIVVVAINMCWHQFRVWMQKFLINGRGYDELATLDVNFWFNVMTDIGCLSAGIATAFLYRSGLTAHWSRCCVFGICALLVATGAAIPWLPKGPALIVILMIVGLGSLGLFPCYYAFTQELSVIHQGKVSGTLGTIAWIFPALWHRGFGRWVDQTKSYDMGMSLASLMPLIAIIALCVVWPRESAEREPAAE